MKKLILLITVNSMLLLSCNFGNRNGQSITVKKTSTTYSFSAEFPKWKTSKVLHYLKQNLHEDRLFRDPEDKKSSLISLGDTLKFHLSTEPGRLNLSFNRTDNSARNCEKLENLCAGIRGVL